MATKAKTPTDNRMLLRKLTKFQFAFVAAFALFTIIFDGGNVLTREAVYRRWMLVGLLLAVYALFWAAVIKARTNTVLYGSLALCVLAGLVLAGYMTYWERGMASTSTVLYLFPIASAAFTKSRTYTVVAALLASATYIIACTKYFYDFFNEGYRVQLYGELFFYSAVFIITGWVIASLAHALKK